MAQLALALLLAQRDPIDILNELGSELRKGLRSKERATLRDAAEKAFNREMIRAKSRKPKIVWEHYADYLSELDEGKRSFSGRDQKPEREVWILACRTALLTLAVQARVPDTPPSTAELFNSCLEAIARARTRLSGEGVDDLRMAAYESVNLIVRGQLRRCRPPKGDAKALYEKNVAQVNLRYGKDSDLPQRMLLDIAKACLDKDATALR